jgi:hypothetical protein
LPELAGVIDLHSSQILDDVTLFSVIELGGRRTLQEWRTFLQRSLRMDVRMNDGRSARAMLIDALCISSSQGVGTVGGERHKITASRAV